MDKTIKRIIGEVEDVAVNSYAFDNMARELMSAFEPQLKSVAKAIAAGFAEAAAVNPRVLQMAGVDSADELFQSKLTRWFMEAETQRLVNELEFEVVNPSAIADLAKAWAAKHKA